MARSIMKFSGKDNLPAILKIVVSCSPVSLTVWSQGIHCDAYITRGPHLTPGELNQNQQGRNLWVCVILISGKFRKHYQIISSFRKKSVRLPKELKDYAHYYQTLKCLLFFLWWYKNMPDCVPRVFRDGGKGRWSLFFQEKEKCKNIFHCFIASGKRSYLFFLISFFFSFLHLPLVIFLFLASRVTLSGMFNKPRATFSYCVFQDGIFSVHFSVSFILQPVYKSQTHIPVSARELVHLLTLQHWNNQFRFQQLISAQF